VQKLVTQADILLSSLNSSKDLFLIDGNSLILICLSL